MEHFKHIFKPKKRSEQVENTYLDGAGLVELIVREEPEGIVIIHRQFRTI